MVSTYLVARKQELVSLYFCFKRFENLTLYLHYAGFARLIFATLLLDAGNAPPRLVLIDDVLSACDVHVSATMIKRGLKLLLATKRIIVIAMSSQSELLEQAGISSATFVTIENGRLASIAEKAMKAFDVAEDEPVDLSGVAVVEINPKLKEHGQLTVDEKHNKGKIENSVVRSYFDAAAPGSCCSGYAVLIGILLLYTIGQALCLLADLSLTWWVEEKNDPSVNYMLVAGALVAGSSVVVLARSVVCVLISSRSAKYVHNSTLKALLRAPLLYFQQNPIGRLLNRFSSDISRVDLILPHVLFQFLDNAFVLSAALILSCVAVPWIILLILPLSALLYFVQKMFRSTSREVQRLEGMAKSPLFSLFGSSLQGRSSIRAYGERSTNYFTAQMQKRLNVHSRGLFLSRILQRWLSLNLNTVIIFLETVLSFLALALSRTYDSSQAMIEASLAGLAVVYSLQLLGLSSYTLMLVSMLENALTALERVLEVGAVAPEESIDQGAAIEGDSWPSAGKIEFEDVCLRYRKHLPLALNGLTFSVNPGERVGVVGRTGAGKSSLLAALFRLFPLAGGQIKLDGVNIASIPLATLRSRIGLITQNPVIFSGSIRYNVDPFGLCSDADIWEALEKSQLKRSMGSAESLLDYECGTGGCELSHGQRQLLAITRVLLKRSRLLFCDEATSSVDAKTDKLIQSVIKEMFWKRGKTILTIAHRLQTIRNSDSILVMKDGRIVEHGPPQELENMKDGVFAGMISAVSNNNNK